MNWSVCVPYVCNYYQLNWGLSMPNFELTASSLQSLAFQLPASSLQLPGSRLQATYSSCKPVASSPRRKVPKQEKKTKIRGFGKSRGFDWEGYQKSIKQSWKSLKTYIFMKTYCFIKRFLLFHRFQSQNWYTSWAKPLLLPNPLIFFCLLRDLSPELQWQSQYLHECYRLQSLKGKDCLIVLDDLNTKTPSGPSAWHGKLE